jgi:hypothetical protein
MIVEMAISFNRYAWEQKNSFKLDVGYVHVPVNPIKTGKLMHITPVTSSPPVQCCKP